MKRILLVSSLVLLSAAAGRTQSNDFVTIAPEPAGYAWWLRAEFHPFETQVRGIPVGQLRATWCKATEFRKDLFPPESLPDIEESGASFTIDGFFDGSKTRQTALIGVYETCGGERGSFLLVLARPSEQPPVVRFLHEMPGPQFGMLKALRDSTIVIFHCLSCDNVSGYRWDKSKKRFVPRSLGAG